MGEGGCDIDLQKLYDRNDRDCVVVCAYDHRLSVWCAMTIIVYADNVLVVDKSGTDGDSKWPQIKAWPQPNGEVITGVGPAVTILQMRDWYLAGAHPKQMPLAQYGDNYCEFIVVNHQGVRRWERGPVAMEHGTYACAFGIGRDFAYGALAAGADAVEAAEIACHYSNHCGLGLDIFKFMEIPNGTKH